MIENLARTLSPGGQSTEQYRACAVAGRPLANLHRPLARARPTGFDEHTLRQLARACDYDAQRISRHFGISVRHLQRWFNAHLASTPLVSLTYWDPTHDTCTADAEASWHNDDATKSWLWDRYKNAPAPVGYDPAIIPAWSPGPSSPAFGALRLDPTALRVIHALDFAHAKSWRR